MSLNKDIARTIIQVAESQLGVKEEPIGSNEGKEVSMYLKSVGLGAPNYWCMAFVYWCFERACKNIGIDNPLLRTGLVMSQWKDRKGIIRITPDQSDLITKGSIFIQSHGNGKGHTGIVTDVEGGDIHTIEGNTNDDGSRDGIGVFRRVRNISRQTGFILIPEIINTEENRRKGQPTSVETVKPKPKEYVFITNEEKMSVQEFLDKNNINLKPRELLDYRSYDNEAAIFNSYTNIDKKKHGQAVVEQIEANTKVAVPKDTISSKSVYLLNQNIVENVSLQTFIEQEAKKLFNDERYRKSGDDYSLYKEGSYSKKYEFSRVWIWTKALNGNGVDFIDVTPFVKWINMNSSDTGGNFSIDLAHLTFNKSKINPEQGISFDDLYVNAYDINDLKAQNFFHKEATHEFKRINITDIKAKSADEGLNYNVEIFRRNESFFHHFLQNNDLVVIRLEQLLIDKNSSKESPFSSLNVPSTKLAGEIVDMFGLIDDVSMTNYSQNTVQSPTISGRDLSKLLIDDGVYFFDIEYTTEDREQIIKNSTKTKAGNRLIIPKSKTDTGEYEDSIRQSLQGFAGDTAFNFDKTQSIEEWLVFIFSQLTNIDICPDSLFRGYKERNFIITREQTENGFDYKKVLANGIWQMCKLAIDPAIADRRIADTSFTTATGSLMNLINRIAQKPFIDFRMDTYGDKFYFIFRKPPFAEQEFRTNFCVDIYEQDLIRDDLQFTNDFYTWYKLNPAGSIINSSDSSSLALLPAVMLPEYMEIWGSKVLDITTQYLDFDMSTTEDSKSNIDRIQQQGREDLDWLIETNAYLPFVREGSITIKPDRRIKHGMNVRLMSTGEIFHVDGVSNDRKYMDNVQQTTTLQVSRGMVERHLEKYFNIVNLLRNTKNKDEWDKETWTVNRENFEFLMKRKQFYK